MGKREQDKKRSLDALARIAHSTAGAPPTKSTPPSRPTPRPAPAPPPVSRAPSLPATDAQRARQKQLEERRAKLEEEKRLRDRRANELARGARIDMSRIDPFGIPSSIRRTGFDRQEASTSQKIHDVLGDAREKEGRAKAKAKGKRQGGR